MLRFVVFLSFFIAAFFTKAFCQDTLPRISVKNIGGRVIISWKNTYGARINNINVQRSTDSLKRFTTIGTILNPMNRENGFFDPQPGQAKVFYRVFVAFEGGDYVFTKSYRPVIDTSTSAMAEQLIEEKKEVKPVVPGGFVPSKFVYTGRDNNVILNLPGAPARKFSIKFYDEQQKPVFEINSIREPYLILDKVNFIHSGWFNYTLFDNEVILEKYKFYIPKDGRAGNGGREQKK